MLRHAFETLPALRVEIVTTTTNVRSQKAIERLSATREGLLRQKYYGLDYYIYAIVRDEWPDVREKLLGSIKP